MPASEISNGSPFAAGLAGAIVLSADPSSATEFAAGALTSGKEAAVPSLPVTAVMVDFNESVRTAKISGLKCLPLMAMAMAMPASKTIMTPPAISSASGTFVRTNCLRFPAPDFFSFAMK